MKKVLVTGGTVFVSRYIAEYYVAHNYDVYVLNRNSREQSQGVTLIQADRHNLGDILNDMDFDIVIDTAYNSNEVDMLLDALGGYKEYILISSSAVYPEHIPQPFEENAAVGINKYWGKYGTDKIEAENTLMKRNPNAYILRPPYLYGPMNNVYREAFVFDCALEGRKFYLPKNGEMKLQFFYIQDLCRFIDIILNEKPTQHIFNVGNPVAISVREWVELCYRVVGHDVEFVNIYDDIEQRNYFSFYDYEYYLDVSKQCELMPETKPIYKGLQEAFDWYKDNADQVNKKPLFDYIDKNIKNIKNIVFDVGMVLIDFCWVQHCKNLGFSEKVIDCFDKNMISSEYWDKMDEGIIVEADAIREFIKAMPQYREEIEIFWKHPEGFVQEYSYATPMIRRLKQKGYKVYLLSNYPLGMYQVHWPTFSFFSEVDGYIVSALERMKKPDKRIYKLLCERYRLNAEECLFIDDRQVNVDAAIEVGMKSVLFEEYEKLETYLNIEM